MQSKYCKAKIFTFTLKVYKCNIYIIIASCVFINTLLALSWSVKGTILIYAICVVKFIFSFMFLDVAMLLILLALNIDV